MKTHEIWAGKRDVNRVGTPKRVSARRSEAVRRFLAFFKRPKITVTSRTALKYDKEYGLHHRYGALSKQDIRDGGATITLTLHGDTFVDPLTNKMKRQIIKGIRGPRWWALFKRWPLKKGGWWL